MPEPGQEYVTEFRSVFDQDWDDPALIRAVSGYREHAAAYLSAQVPPNPFLTSMPSEVTPEALIAAVRGMDDTQRAELNELLGLPAPRHPFLWIPSGGGFSRPLGSLAL